MKTYVDMDGVLVDFFRAAHELHNRNVDDYPVGEWNMEMVFHIGFEEFVKDMTTEWWATLPKTSYCDYIMDFVINPVFLTTHMDGRCVEGKEAWIKKYFPNVPLVLTRDKGAVACNDSVLIDDRKINMLAFKHCVFVPAIWNERYEERGDVEVIVKQEYRNAYSKI